MADVKHFDPEAVLDEVVRLFWRRGMAPTGIQDVVTATGVSRSSLYATFGGKRELHRAALERYVEQWSAPAFRALAEDGRGLPAIAAFFNGLIEARCSGEYAHWGCMVVNAHAGAENGDPHVQDVLDRHHRQLRDAMRTALVAAATHGQLAPGVAPAATAETLALLAYGVNVRSRSRADASALRSTVTTTLTTLAAPAAGVGDG
ncbi:TetR/AcrR family transcriptional regulator [Streptomyces sp. NPDC050485]|uniref:TetR/AcrR family transcriptional regulator n=1 Tax=Streptomyces sp. NPDC050485 TaxID=3365617 RepID=UPI00379E264B